MTFGNLPAAEFAPDSVAVNSPYTSDTRGVYPTTAAGNNIYRPFPEKVASTFATVPSTALMGVATREDGDIYNIVGATDKIYLFNDGTSLWDTVFTPAGAIEKWEIAIFGKTFCAVNSSNRLLTYTIGVDSVFTEVAATPLAPRHVAAVRDFIFIGNWPANQQKIQWSAINNATSWPTPGTDAALSVLAGEQQFPGEGGEIRKIVAGAANADVLIFFDNEIRRGAFVGNEIMWQFDLVEGSIGTFSSDSVTVGDGYVYYYSPEGFMRTTDGRSERIGAGKVDEWFKNTLNAGAISLISAKHYQPLKLVAWAFSTNGTFNDKVLVYNYENQMWGLINESVDAFTVGYSAISSLDDTSVFGTDLDAYPISLDSEILSASRRLFPYLKNNILYYFNGVGRAWEIHSHEIEDVEQRNLKIYNSSLKYGGTSATYLMSVGTRDQFGNAMLFTTPAAPNNLNEVPSMVQGKVVKLKATGSDTNMPTIYGFGIDSELGGRT
jgi:hypothetical protein